jgi:hypothetical protein
MRCIGDRNINSEPSTQLDSGEALNAEAQIHTSLIEIKKSCVDFQEADNPVGFSHSCVFEEDFDFEI